PQVGVHPKLQPIIVKLLEANPELRYATAVDVITDLKRLQQELKPATASARSVYVAVGLAVVFAIVMISVWCGRRPPKHNQWVQLTNLPDSVIQPALSPDGRMLTFVRGPDTFYTPGQVYIKMLPDGEPVQITRDAYLKMSPVFSPDGSRIAYTTVTAEQGKP